MSPSASSVIQRISKIFKNLNDVKTAFKTIDTDNDGLLSKKEMMASSGNKYEKLMPSSNKVIKLEMEELILMSLLEFCVL